MTRMIISRMIMTRMMLTKISRSVDDETIAQKPDLVIVNKKSKDVKLVELTVPWDTTANMAAAMTRKTERYNELTTNIQGNGFKCFNIPLEQGEL